MRAGGRRGVNTPKNTHVTITYQFSAQQLIITSFSVCSSKQQHEDELKGKLLKEAHSKTTVIP